MMKLQLLMPKLTQKLQPECCLLSRTRKLVLGWIYIHYHVLQLFKELVYGIRSKNSIIPIWSLRPKINYIPFHYDLFNLMASQGFQEGGNFYAFIICHRAIEEVASCNKRYTCQNLVLILADFLPTIFQHNYI